MNEPSCPRLRVLVVDDDQSITKMFGWMVEMLGHDGMVANESAEALALARSFRPDVVLMDLNIAGTNGHDACRRMRQMPGLEHCIFIAQTGWDHPAQIERSREAGFHDHWVKPISIERLEKLFDTLSSKKAA